jgi:aryl-alcohol dehydrogenase-like predicted oxidoreductase
LDYGISNESGKTPKKEVKRILNFAQIKGIDTLDTAIAYGDSEKVLGSIGVESFKIVSKYLPESESKLTIDDQLINSLSNLKLHSIYGYLAHRPEDVLNNYSEWDQLKRFKEQGIVKKIGFSLNKPEELESLLSDGFQPDIVQVPFNYFDRRFEQLTKQLHEDGCEVHSRSTFLQGLFFRDPNTLPTHFEEVKDLIQDIKNSTENLAGSLLRFVLEKPFIDRVIIGVENITQLKENLESLNKVFLLPDTKFEISDSILIPSNWPK